MTDTPATTRGDLPSTLMRDGFAFVDAGSMRPSLEPGTVTMDWSVFAQSWNDLAIDGYLADHGRYRRRRHAVYSATSAGMIQRRAHQPHFQSRDYNRLYGDIERWFEPIAPDIGDSPGMHSILHFCIRLFGKLSTDVRTWHVEAHQFRIEARSEESGQPTPEGVHRDGVDYVLVLLIARCNIVSGTTTIHALDHSMLGSFTLRQPFDAAFVDDSRVFHGVTPVEPQNPELPAYRDVLVVTFKSADN